MQHCSCAALWANRSRSAPRLASSRGPNTGPSHGYTPAGRPASRTWARGIATWYTNNTAGELAVVNYSDATPDVTYTYDRRGRQTSVAQSGGTAITRNLSDAGLVLWESYSGGSLSGFGVTNAFDQFLRRTNVATAGVSTGYRYDNASRLARVLDGANAVGYSYVANSPLLGQIAFTNNGAQRMVTTKTHDYVNRLTGIASVSASATASFGYAYNSASQRTGVTNSDNSYWVYTYDSMGQVTSGRKYFSDGTPVAGQQFDYAFDDVGNRQTTTRDSRSAFYTNNLLNQITGRTVPGYVNVLGTATNTATVTVNNQPTARKGDYYRTELGVLNSSAPVWLGVTNIAVLNQGANPDIVASVTGNVFVARSPEICGYDADGNLTNDGRWVFTWDAENRLKQVESRSDAPSLSRRKVAWEFDGQGRRIRQTTSDGSSGSWVVTEDLKLLSDGWAHIAELNATNNALVRSYVWGLDLSGSLAGAGGVGGLLIVNSVANGSHFCAYDGNGNVAALVKATDGTETARYEYGPFGEPIRATGAMAKENAFRFSTKRTDNTTDFVLYEYRLYSPSMGRWLSRDPIGENGGIQIYAWALNDPVGKFDVLGMACDETLVVVFLTRLDDRLNSESFLNSVREIHKKLIWKVVKGGLPAGTKGGKQRGYGQSWKAVYFVDFRYVNAASEFGPRGSGATPFYPIVWPNRIRRDFRDHRDEPGGVPASWRHRTDTDACYQIGGHAMAHEVLHSVGRDSHYGGNADWLMTAKPTWQWLVQTPLIDQETVNEIVRELDVE